MLVLPVLILLSAPAANAGPATCDAKPFAFNTSPKKPAAQAPKPRPAPPPKPAQTASVTGKKKPAKPGCDLPTDK
jgi:hypothetical protein